MIAIMATIQKYLFDRSDDRPDSDVPRRCKPGRYHDSYRPRLTKEQREKRRRQRERWERRQVFFFGPRVRRKRSKNLFHLIPDVPVDEVELHDPELHSLAQAVIYNRAQMIQQTWSPNKQRKRNNFYVEPLQFRPIDDDLRFDSHEVSE